MAMFPLGIWTGLSPLLQQLAAPQSTPQPIVHVPGESDRQAGTCGRLALRGCPRFAAASCGRKRQAALTCLGGAHRRHLGETTR